MICSLWLALQMRSISGCSSLSLADWRYCVGQSCCCLSSLSKSWEDHFIIVCLLCLTLSSRWEPLGKLGLAAVFAVFSIFYLVAVPLLSRPLLCEVCCKFKTSKLVWCGNTKCDEMSSCLQLLKTEMLYRAKNGVLIFSMSSCKLKFSFCKTYFFTVIPAMFPSSFTAAAKKLQRNCFRFSRGL